MFHDSVAAGLMIKNTRMQFKAKKAFDKPVRVERFLKEQKTVAEHIQRACQGQIHHRIWAIRHAYEVVALPMPDYRETEIHGKNQSNIYLRWREAEVWGTLISKRKYKLTCLPKSYRDYL